MASSLSPGLPPSPWRRNSQYEQDAGTQRVIKEWKLAQKLKITTGWDVSKGTRREEKLGQKC